MAHYKITVLEVGYVEKFPADFTFDGFHLSGEYICCPFSMVLLQGEGKNILVDCGINLRDPVKQEIFKAAGGVNGHSPDEVLAEVGLTPSEIDAVILTHMHWDHAGGASCYPNAVFYLQREELEGWSEISDNPAYSALHFLSMDLNDLNTMKSLLKEDRLILLDGERDDLFPGISIRVSRFAHSFAQQMVYIENDTGLFLAVGDTCNRPENLLGTETYPFFLPNTKFAVGGTANAVRDYTRIMQWVNGDVSRVIMTHDGTRREHFNERKTPLGLSVFEVCI